MILLPFLAAIANTVFVKQTNGLLWAQLCWKPEVPVFGETVVKHDVGDWDAANDCKYGHVAESSKFDHMIMKGAQLSTFQIQIISPLFLD